MRRFLIIIFAALFLIDLCLVITGQTQKIDDSLLGAVIGLRGSALTAFFSAITFCGDVVPTFCLCVLVIILPGRMKAGLPVAVITGVASVIQTSLKILIARPRPDTAIWLVPETGFSFPSGHATASMVFWVALSLLFCRALILRGHRPAAILLRIVFIVFPVLIGLSRIYLGVHYPSDIFGGWMLAGLLLTIFSLLYEKVWPSKWRVGSAPRKAA